MLENARERWKDMSTLNQALDLFPKRRANVIWVFGDQLRAQALGYREDPNVRTPNIDNLARWGMRFDCAVSGAPWCSPFRAALLSSLYPNQSGVIRTPGALDPNIPTVTEPFRKAGYHTAWVGKWHLDGTNSRVQYVAPERRGGFDYWMGYEYNDHQNEVYVYGTQNETPQRLSGYETDSLTDLLIDHLRNHVQQTDDGEYQPFFASLSVQPPHNPYVTPTVTDGRYYHNPTEIKLRPNVPHVDWVKQKAALDLAGYYGMVENLDMNVGKLRLAMKELDIDRETYVIFFSDHGDCLGSHAQWGKSSPWEESIKIPFIVFKEDGMAPMKKGKTDVVMNHVDIAPTTLGLCGIHVPDWMVGYNYSHVCKKAGDVLPSHIPEEPDSVYLQQIPRKYHLHSVNQAWRGVLMRDGWKYVCMPGQDWLLFDTKSDPYEMANLCHDIAFSKQRERCHARLSQWIVETGDRFEMPAL
jgi:arylsulfatase A-like enzyme